MWVCRASFWVCPGANPGFRYLLFSLKIPKEFTWPLGDCMFVYTRPQVNIELMLSEIPTSGSFWAWVILTRGGNIPGDHPWHVDLLQDRAELRCYRQSLPPCCVCLTFYVDTWSPGLLTLYVLHVSLLPSPLLKSSNIYVYLLNAQLQISFL